MGSEQAKARAVAALQRLFFEELSGGQDASGAAARALLRLNAAAAASECSLEPEAGLAVPPSAQRSGARIYGACATEMLEIDVEAEADEEADLEAVPVPRMPARPEPAIDAPTRRRPSSMARRVAVRN